MTLPSSRQHAQDDKPPPLLPRESRGLLLRPPSTIIPRNKVERARKNVSRACRACRQRRIRCTSTRPCRPCEMNGLECLDDSSPEGVDLRTIRLAPNNQRVFVQQKTVLDSLLRTIRSGTADAVIKRVREGASLEDIAKALQEAESGPQTSETNDSSTSSKGSDDREGDLLDMSSSQDMTANRRQDIFRVLDNFGNLPISSAIRANGYSSHIQDMQIMHLSNAPWDCLPLTSDDASTNDAFSLSCLSFRNLARKQLAERESREAILSLHGIEMDLLFRERTPNDPHSVSNWACELLKTFNFLPQTVKLAAAELIACLMRWLIEPSKETYLALPDSSKPTERQIFVPHGIGVDVMICPQIRDALLERNGDTTAWTNIVHPDVMDFNWPYSIDACLELMPRGLDGHGSTTYLSKAFTEHVHNLNNVSLEEGVCAFFPEFRNMFRLHAPRRSASIISAPALASNATVFGGSLDTIAEIIKKEPDDAKI